MIRLLRPLHDDLECRDQRQRQDEGIQPVRRPARQQLVVENPGHDRLDNPEQVGDNRCQHDEGHRRPRTLQAFPGEGHRALPLAGGNECL